LQAQAPLQVTSTTADYKKQVAANPDMKMIELKSIIPELKYDLRYATTNNFMNRRMYPWRTKKTFLRAPAANALLGVQKELNAKGLGLKIFDAYRPYAVTVKFWELVRDERYVANPAKGSGHNRGIAVDLTIINLKTGQELDMGTGFDNFTDTAHHDFKSLSSEVLENRTLLRTTMEKHGFRKYDTEWWHYFLPGGDKFSVLDLPFKRL
jgi:D-alanyl-D-alanine dipeptidase